MAPIAVVISGDSEKLMCIYAGDPIRPLEMS